MENNEICQKCGVDTEGDIRTLWMDCLYNMNELGIPFKEIEVGNQNYYTLRVCKGCRSDWMKAIKVWFETPKPCDICDSGIYIRGLGHDKQVNEAKFKQKYFGRT